jgi:Domain of unknown function (DUF4286)
MIIYNITVNVDNDVKDEWLHWMKSFHIPNVLATGYFTENKICKVLVDEEQGTTYSVQYTCESMAAYETYKQLHASRFQQESAEKYGNKQVSFRTLLEVL